MRFGRPKGSGQGEAQVLCFWKSVAVEGSSFKDDIGQRQRKEDLVRRGQVGLDQKNSVQVKRARSRTFTT